MSDNDKKSKNQNSDSFDKTVKRDNYLISR